MVYFLIKKQQRLYIKAIVKKYLHYYFAEFCYRFNIRFWQRQLFDRMIYACLITKTVTLAELRT